jgi:Protein of unknown function (DUF3800)
VTTFWKVCLDDTCDEKRQDYICAGSLIGTKDGWNSFNKEWRKALKADPPINYFHGKEFPRLTGEFEQFKDKDLYPKPTGLKAAIAKRELLRQVIIDSSLVAFGVGVLVPEYNRIREEHPRGKTFMAADAFEYILQELVYRTAKTIIEYGLDVKVSFISDKSNRSPVYELVYENWKKSNPTTAKSMLGITHEDDETNYGLQAADMVASSVNWVYRSHLKDGKVPDDYPLNEVFWRIGRIDEKYLLSMLGHQSHRESEGELSPPDPGQDQ